MTLTCDLSGHTIEEQLLDISALAAKYGIIIKTVSMKSEEVVRLGMSQGDRVRFDSGAIIIAGAASYIRVEVINENKKQ